MSDSKVTYLYSGLSKDERARRKAGMISRIDRPKKLQLSNRDKAHLVAQKNRRWAKIEADRLQEIEDKIDDLDTARDIRGLSFVKGEPVTVDYAKYGLSEGRSLRAKLDAFVANGTLSLYTPEPKKEKPSGNKVSNSGPGRGPRAS